MEKLYYKILHEAVALISTKLSWGGDGENKGLTSKATTTA